MQIQWRKRWRSSINLSFSYFLQIKYDRYDCLELQISGDEFRRVLSLYSASLEKSSLFQRTRKNDPYRMDSMFWISSQLSFIIIVSIIRQPSASTSDRSRRIKSYLSSISGSIGIPQLVLGVYGLYQCPNDSNEKQYRSLLRSVNTL